MPDSITYWNRKAAGYDGKIVKASNYAARLERAWAVMPEGAVVLDVGCATGEITLDLAPRCGRIVGIDHAPKMAEAGNAKALRLGLSHSRFEAMDAFDHRLATGSFDVVVNYSLLHLVDDAAATIRRFHELLKPGGHLVTEAPCLGDWHAVWGVVAPAMVAVGLAPPIRRLRRSELESAMTAAGFELLDSSVHNPKSGQHCFLARKRAG